MTTEPDEALKTFAKKLILPLSDSSDFFEAADYVVIELSADHIERIRNLSAVVRDLAVYRISEFNYDCEFMVADYEVDPEQGKVALKEFEGRTECHTLNVTDHDCYWSGYYKHTSVRWETASVPLTALAEDGDYDLREEVGDKSEDLQQTVENKGNPCCPDCAVSLELSRTDTLFGIDREITPARTVKKAISRSLPLPTAPSKGLSSASAAIT
jgi:hypothetical protein